MSTPLVLACHWICRLCWCHILFMMFSVLGLGLFGVCPATVACCNMLRRYLNGAQTVTIKMMWTEYKTEFVRANKVVLLFAFVGFVFFFYYSYGINVESTALNIVGYFCIVMFLLTAFVGYSCLAMLSIYDATNFKGILQNGAVMLRDVYTVAGTIAAIITTYLVEKFIPVVGFFYGLAPVLYATIGIYWYTKELS